MDAAPAREEKFIDVTSMRVIDLCSLGQDEIKSLARLYGGGSVPAGLVDVTIDKSIFNESSSSRRQTLDRHRLRRNRERRYHHLYDGAHPRAHLHRLAIERDGGSHRDLILHFWRQIHIGEQGDMALYPPSPHPRTALPKGNQGKNLIKMARVSNGKAAGHGEAMRRSTRSKEEDARRKGHARRHLQKETRPLTRMVSCTHEEHANVKDSPGTFMRRSSRASSKRREMKKLKITPKIEKSERVMNGKNLRCICGKLYATPFTLRRHIVTTCMAHNKTSMPPADRQESDANVTDGTISEKGLGKDNTKRLWKGKANRFKCRHCLKRFMRKKLYLRHLQKHIRQAKKKPRRAKKKISRQTSNEWAANGDLKVEEHVGKLDVVKYCESQRRLNNKRKREQDPASDMRHVKSRQTLRSPLPRNAMTFTCQECGKAFGEFSRYSGHLRIHSRLRKVYVGEATTAVDKKHLQEWSALGFRRLLNETTTGTHLPGLPAQLLFCNCRKLVDRKGEVLPRHVM